jgi:ABC-type phosphate/phosphonate transport system permease subunit
MNKQHSPLRRSLLFALLVFAGVIVYAYGFQVTDVSLEEMKIPRRQEQFFRILRALFHPDIIEYEQTEAIVSQPIFIACPEGDLDIPEPDMSQAYMQIFPPCSDPNTEVVVEGHNFAPDIRGPINLIPPSGVTLQLGNFTTDSEGNFRETVRLPRRQPVEEAQQIQAITRQNVGSPYLSRNGRETWNAIIETVFLALLATTLGTFLAIPVSFLAARNIMKDIKSPVASVALSILAWPLGILAGGLIGQRIGELSQSFTSNLAINLAGLIASPLILWGAARWALPQEESQKPSPGLRLARLLALIVAALAGVLVLFLLGNLAMSIGEQIEDILGPFGFLGNFLANLGEIVQAVVTIITALAVGALLSGWAGRLGQTLTERLSASTLRGINMIIGAVAGAVLFAILGAIVEWLYGVGNLAATLWIPAAVGALLAVFIIARTRPKESLAVGLSIYYVVRTILNTLRSIEAFIMAIIFVVLLSTGPFAGVMALSLHTIAALAKLYSEQVESIMPGPLEAIKATGANRLQTIIYAVIPQIVPPYISFTMYRWDINVRMSTIIGFVGGGGIGLLLQQNINLLNYRAASAQMLAITIVVALMDYISSYIRERVV